jgi:coatomer subunit delta
MQRREQQRRAAQGGLSDFSGNSGGFGTISNSGGYSSVPRFEASSPVPRTESPQPKAKAPAFKGTGMKLGATKKLKQAEALDALGSELATPDMSRSATPSIPAAASSRPAAAKSSVPSVTREG